MLTGTRGHPGENPFEILYNIANVAIVPLHELRPDCPSELEQVVVRMLSPEPENRYHSLLEVGAALLPKPLRVAAGSIALEVQAPGYLPIVRTVVVPARGLAREPLFFVPVPPAAKPLPPQENPAPQLAGGSVTPKEEKPQAQPSTWGTGLTVGVILGLAALGSLGSGVAFHLTHESRAKSYKDHGCQTNLPPADCQSRYDSVNSAEYIAIAGYVGAAVLGGVATYLLVRGASAPAEKVAAAETGFHFQCSPTPGLGVVCAGRF